MKLAKTLSTWLETRGAAPAYGGWVLAGLTLCFWVAAANTMAGWLYVLSGVGAALCLLSAALPVRALQNIEVTRTKLLPIHVGELLSVSLRLRNATAQVKGLLTLHDQVPPELGAMGETVVEAIAPYETYTWDYSLEPQRRGLYRWKIMVLRTGAPLGLFWSRRIHTVPAEAMVYPRVLPLARCPILDEVGASPRALQQVPLSRSGSEGSTRSLRPYRWGDPIRMVHWRSSARFNALRVRELEVMGGGTPLAIALDTQGHWHPDRFEQAVMAAASLYHYATQQHGSARLWTSQWGLVQGMHAVLEVLAQIEPQPTPERLPEQSVIWLTTNPDSIANLPRGSRFILWPQATSDPLPERSMADANSAERFIPHQGMEISQTIPLQIQLQTGWI